jgi:hypothetical protein
MQTRRKRRLWTRKLAVDAPLGGSTTSPTLPLMSNRAHRRPSRNAGRSTWPEPVITTDAARSAGWTEAAQRHAVRVGDVERLQRGVLGRPVASDPESSERALEEAANLRAAQAASLACPRAAISHLSAAIAYSVPTVGDIGRPCLTVPAGTALRHLAHAHLHRATLLDSEVSVKDGYRIVSPARAVMDVARERGVGAGVVAADYALRAELTDRGGLAAAFELCAGWPGRKAARITLLSADADAESPLESLSRLQIAQMGLPKPQLQPSIGDQYGRFIGRCDFYWDEFGVVGEADGDLKYEGGRPVIVQERRRQKLLEETGLIVVRWGWSDLFTFDAVARRLGASFRRGARPGSPDRRWTILRGTSALHL